MALGDNLRRLRVNQGLTQGDLSLSTGIKLGQISKIETNKAKPGADTIYKFMDALDCSADSLFMDKERTGLKGVLKEAFEYADKLPEFEQEILIEVIERFCQANGFKTMLSEHRVLIDFTKDKVEYPPLNKK